MVEITHHYGIIVRVQAFEKNGISIAEFVKQTEATFIGQDQDLVSFGPCFGEEAGNRIATRIEALGFEYVSDYFVFNLDVPEWIGLSAYSKS
jgi:hypothetical protein